MFQNVTFIIHRLVQQSTAERLNPWCTPYIIQISTRVRYSEGSVLEQASPVLLYHTQYTLYIMQPSTRVRCSEARLAVLQTVYYTVLYVTQPRTGVRCSEESVLQRCSVTVLQ